jgi:DNA-binding Lrp family transcriptional regulator
VKEAELKLISELVRNSRRSDKDLAKAINTSRPKVTRMRTRLENEGAIKEYTIIPDLNKLGFEILAITFLKLKKLSQEEIEKARKTAKEELKKAPFEIVMLQRGIGLGYEGVVISYHKDYSSYLNLIQWIKHFDFLEPTRVDSFLVDLKDEVQYKPLTFATLATSLSTVKETKSPNKATKFLASAIT